MAQVNVAARSVPLFTHEGAPASLHLTAEQQLRRSVCSCLLWEGEFYENGITIAERIVLNASLVDPKVLAALAIEARTVLNLRHVPLLLLEILSKTGAGDSLVAATIDQVIQRADELGELIAIHHKLGAKKMLPAQMRKGLGRALLKFNEFTLAKYDRDSKVKLRDVLRLTHPKPVDDVQSALWKRVKDRTLETPDTWEVALSGGADKKETFTRLLAEGQLGYLALLRNLRNMVQAGVDTDLVNRAIVARKGGAQRVLPFRYVAAARAAPQFEPALDQALIEAVAELPVLSGRTIVLVDVSGSMNVALSGKSDLRRVDAAATLASILPGQLRVFTFSDRVVEVPPRRGMAGVDAVIKSQDHSGSYLGKAVEHLNALPHDRLVVISDEQSHDKVPDPVAKRAYMINPASNRNGVSYNPHWIHLDGFSEGVLRFIKEIEQ